jgi:hypothetical protein
MKEGWWQQCHAAVSKCLYNYICIILSKGGEERAHRDYNKDLNEKNSDKAQLWWFTPVILALRRWRQEDCESRPVW